MFNIVLVAPEIPQNTGTIGRLCVCTDARLHLVEPLGFSLAESRIRRAGLDYWRYLDLQVYRSWPDFIGTARPGHLAFFSTKARKSLYDGRFSLGDYLVFGNETSGLPEVIHTRYRENFYSIPMPGQHARSHNLANAVSIVLYEAYRQIAHVAE